jgi:hypothetical protein
LTLANAAKVKVIVIGASHSTIISEKLKSMGHNVYSLCSPGWLLTTQSVELLLDSIKKIEGFDNAICVIDGISNVTYRFEQEEGITYPPVKLGGKYHMAGKVVSSSKEQLVTSLNKLKPILELLKGEKIFLPPLPRYLYTSCCDLPDHCEGVGSDEVASGMVKIAVSARKTVRDFVHARVSKIWVPDILSFLCDDVSTPDKIASGIKNLYAKDGVHLNVKGYDLVANNLHKIIENKIAASVCVSGRSSAGHAGQPKQYYWKGFISPVGSSRPTNMAAFHHNRPVGGGKSLSKQHNSNSHKPYHRGPKN